MIRIRVQIDDVLAGDIKRTLEDAPKRMEAEIARIVKGLETSLLDDLLSFTPGPVRYPIQWTSERQRRAYFATDGFGHGIPYRRTGRLVSAWRLRRYFSRAGNLITITNDADPGFVIGNPARPELHQQFHANTGWPTPQEVGQTMDFFSEAAEEQMRDAWLDVVTELVYGG